jgi:hypothetical protein
MTWLLLLGGLWLVVAVLLGVLIGRGIRLADRAREQALAAEAPAPEEAPEAPGGIAPPDRMRHPIPVSRPAAVRNPVRTPDRTPTRRESGLR